MRVSHLPLATSRAPSASSSTGLVIRAEIQKLTSNPTNSAAAATATAISGFGVLTEPALYASYRQRKRQAVHCCGRSKEWHEMFLHRRGRGSTRSFESWAEVAFATAQREG